MPAPPADALIRINESICYFRCTSYEIEVRSDGAYKLSNLSNTRQDGQSEGKFDADVWPKALAAFDAAHFSSQPETLNGERQQSAGGPPCINDLPFVTFTRQATAGQTRTVRWNTGCRSPELGALLESLRSLFQYNLLVKPAS